MSHELVILPQAEAELAEAYRWYNQQRARLGDEFLLTVDAAMAAILRSPLLYPLVRSGVHQCVLRRFPFIILYAIQGDRVVVVAVFHTSRNPRRWQRRVKRR